MTQRIDFVALDFETANEKRDSACSIGLVKVKDGIVVDKYYTLLKPEPLRFSPFNIKIHGIKAKDVMNAPTFAEAWPEILAFMNGYTVVAHNASFDMSVLRYSLDHYQIPYPEFLYFCTVKACKKAFPDLENHKLNTVSAHIGFHFHHHNALEDAEACAMSLIAAIKKKQVHDLESFCRITCSKCGQIYPNGYTAAK